MPSIPSISSRATPTEIQRFARAVKMAIERGDLGGLSPDTIARIRAIAEGAPATGEDTDLTPPGPPQNLVATGLFSKIMLQWGAAAGNVAYYEVWWNTVDLLGEAVLAPSRAYTTMAIFHPPNSSLSVTYYFAVRAVSSSGIAGPFNSATMTPGSTADDPEYILEILKDQITASQLYADLQAEIGKISTLESELGVLNAIITDLQQTSEYDENTTYNVGDVIKYDGGLYIATAETTGNLPTDTDYWDKIGDYASLGDAVAAHAVTINNHGVRILAAEGDIIAEAEARALLAATVGNNTAAILSEATTRASADAAISSSVTTLSSQVNSETTGLPAAHSAIQSEATTRASADAALAQGITTLQTNVGDNSAAISAEAITRSNADGALAQDITTLETTVGQNTTAIQQQAISIDGVSAQIVNKIDNNGFVAGYGLASNPVDGTPFSEFYAIADRHAFINPAATVINVSAITRSTTTATVTTATAHGLSTGDWVVMTGAAQGQYNGSKRVTEIVSTTQFRYTVAGSPASPATVQAGFPGLRLAKAVMALTVQGGQVVMEAALVKNLTTNNLAAEEAFIEDLFAHIATTYQQIVGWMLRSADGQVQLDMVNKFLKMTSALNHQVELAPGSIKFWRSGSAAPLFEFNGSSVIMRDPDGTVLLQSGGNINLSRVAGAGNFAALNAITAENQATYIHGLVVPEAWIGDLAVANAKIANLAVDTAKIQNNAVTVSSFKASTTSTTIGGWTAIAGLSASVTRLVAHGTFDVAVICGIRVQRNGIYDGSAVNFNGAEIAISGYGTSVTIAPETRIGSAGFNIFDTIPLIVPVSLTSAGTYTFTVIARSLPGGGSSVFILNGSAVNVFGSVK